MAVDVEAYILDNSYMRQTLLEGFLNLSWSEKFQGVGVCEIVVPHNRANVSLYATGTYIGLNVSDRVMEVKKCYEEVSDDGAKTLKVVCTEIIDILKDRLAWVDLNPLGENPEWVRKGTPKEIVDWVVGRAILGINTPLFAQDAIPNVSSRNLYPSDGIPPHATSINVTTTAPKDVLSYINELCESYKLGFRLYRDRNLGGLCYNTYSGTDRTLGQGLLTPVVFAVDLDNIQNQSLMESFDNYATSVVVYSKQAVTHVYRDYGEQSTFSALKRHVRYLSVTEPEEVKTVEDIKAYQWEVGLRELESLMPIFLLEGEISQTSQYEYNKHYYLGDLVTFQGLSGYANVLRVVEFNITIDAGETKMYPTMKVERLLAPGDWANAGAEEWTTVSGEWNQK